MVFLLCGPACRDESLFSVEVSLLLTDCTVEGRQTKNNRVFSAAEHNSNH